MSRLVASDLPSGVLHEDVEIYKETRKRAINVILLLFAFKYMCLIILLLNWIIEYSSSSRVLNNV